MDLKQSAVISVPQTILVIAAQLLKGKPRLAVFILA